MPQDWQDLTKLTQGSPILVEKVRLVDSGTKIEGEFELPPLARISAEDQVFIMAFIRFDGSIKEMERIFGISYPTVKNRLNQISKQFELLDTRPLSSREETLGQLDRGEISAEEAIKRLSK
jgi:hypothetical protein